MSMKWKKYQCISFALWSYHASILLFRFRNFQHKLHNHTPDIHTQNVCITHGLHITNESSVLFGEYDFILCFIVLGVLALLFSYQIRKCLRQHFLDLRRNFVNITNIYKTFTFFQPGAICTTYTNYLA